MATINPATLPTLSQREQDRAALALAGRGMLGTVAAGADLLAAPGRALMGAANLGIRGVNAVLPNSVEIPRFPQSAIAPGGYFNAVQPTPAATPAATTAPATPAAPAKPAVTAPAPAPAPVAPAPAVTASESSMRGAAGTVGGYAGANPNVQLSETDRSDIAREMARTQDPNIRAELAGYLRAGALPPPSAAGAAPAVASAAPIRTFVGGGGRAASSVPIAMAAPGEATGHSMEIIGPDGSRHIKTFGQLPTLAGTEQLAPAQQQRLSGLARLYGTGGGEFASALGGEMSQSAVANALARQYGASPEEAYYMQGEEPSTLASRFGALAPLQSEATRAQAQLGVAGIGAESVQRGQDIATLQLREQIEAAQRLKEQTPQAISQTPVVDPRTGMITQVNQNMGLINREGKVTSLAPIAVEARKVTSKVGEKRTLSVAEGGGTATFNGKAWIKD